MSDINNNCEEFWKLNLSLPELDIDHKCIEMMYTSHDTLDNLSAIGYLLSNKDEDLDERRCLEDYIKTLFVKTREKVYNFFLEETDDLIQMLNNSTENCSNEDKAECLLSLKSRITKLFYAIVVLEYFDGPFSSYFIRERLEFANSIIHDKLDGVKSELKF